MTIKEAQELVDAWGDKHAIRHNELANMALLTEEIGKLARVMVRRYGEHAADPRFRGEATDEIGDILWALIGVANQTGVDLTAALIRVLERKSEESEAPSGRKARFRANVARWLRLFCRFWCGSEGLSLARANENESDSCMLRSAKVRTRISISVGCGLAVADCVSDWVSIMKFLL